MNYRIGVLPFHMLSEQEKLEVNDLMQIYQDYSSEDFLDLEDFYIQIMLEGV